MALLQGHANLKSKNLEDKEVDQLVSTNSHVTNRNGCTDLTNDTDAKVEISARVAEEDGVNETSEYDEDPPLKKTKCLTDECYSGAEDGGVDLSLGFQFFLKFLKVIL